MTKMGFIKGALLGVVAGILVAPMSGKQTRENVKKYYQEISGKITEELSRLKGITKETYAKVVDSVVHGFVETKKITLEEAEAIKTQLKDGYEKVKKTHEDEMKKESVQ